MADALTPAKYQDEAMKMRALELYYDFSEGKPTVEKVAEKLGVPTRTVREWFAKELPREVLDSIVPLWPNIATARQFASDRAQAALETVEDIMVHSRSDKIRLEAAIYLLSLAGVRPEEVKQEEATGGPAENKPAVLLNLFVGGGGAPKIVEVEAREISAGGSADRQAPTRLAATMLESEPVPILEEG